MIRFFKSLYLSKRFFWYIGGNIFLFVLGYFFELFFAVGKVALLLLFALSLLDMFLLYAAPKNAIAATRTAPERLSNGDENKISIHLKNNYATRVLLSVIDEIPHQFQTRSFEVAETLRAGQEKKLVYFLRPTERGEYDFGRINVFAKTPLSFISRRFRAKAQKLIPVYPSYLQMRKYELMAISNKLTEAGIKKLRRIANNKEFEQIREYVKGDDYRTINWKATARRSKLMVNQYQDERSQQVYCLIDMGRTMKMPFKGMSLLDYAINASLVISNIAMYKHDKAGLFTFSKKIHTALPADRKSKHILKILDALYKQQPDFLEPNYELLYASIKRHIKQRSLLLLFTNFEGLSSMKRQLNFFQQLAKHHLLVVIFFENTEIKSLLSKKSEKVEDIYIKTIAEKFTFEKRQIVKELNKYGVHAILSEPDDLNVNTINKYLELKALGQI